MKAIVQCGTDYPEMYEISKVSAVMWKDNVTSEFAIHLENPEYTITVSSNLLKFQTLSSEKDDVYGSWKRMCEYAYRRLITELKDTDAVNLTNQPEDGIYPLTFIISDKGDFEQAWNVSIEIRS